MGGVTNVIIPYKPRREQLLIHEALDAYRWVVAVCHRRMGKTVCAVNHLQRAAVTLKRERPRFAYVAPTYRQGKAIAWDYMVHYAALIPGVQVNHTELRIDYPNGGQVRIYGADNPDSLRGIYLDGFVADEYGLHPPNVFTEVLRATLADREGWAAFFGTPNGKNQFYDMAQLARGGAEGWQFLEFPASATAILSAGELATARQVMTPDEYQQEFECSFEAAIRGAIYAQELQAAREQGRIATVPYDPALPVDTDWDLGVGDSTAIWFSQSLRSGEIRLIDYYENSGEGLPHYAQVLTQRGYVYGQHWAPHDIAVRELGSGRSRIETARALGIAFRVAPQIGLEEGIHAARLLFPRCWFDRERCAAGIEALQHYARDYNTRLNEFKATPLHNWASHGSDAFRTLAVRHKAPPPKPKPIEVSRYGATSADLAWMA